MNRFYKLLTVTLVFFMAHNSFAMKGSLTQQSISKKKAVTKKVKLKVSKRSDVRALAALKRKEEEDYYRTISFVALMEVPYYLPKFGLSLAAFTSTNISASHFVEPASNMVLNNATMTTFNHFSAILKHTNDNSQAECTPIHTKEIARQAVTLKKEYSQKKALVYLIAAGVTTAKAGYDLYRFYNEGDIPSWVHTANFGLDGIWLLGSLVGTGYHLKESCK